MRWPTRWPVRLLWRCLLPGLLAIPVSSRAASLQIAPVIIDFAAGVNATGVTLRNPGTAPLYGQIRIYRWTQSVDRDHLLPTDDLIASPPLMQIPPLGQQWVRLIRRHVTPSPVEESYRLLIDEIAPPDQDQAAGVTIRLRYSVPVFVGAAPGTPATDAADARSAPMPATPALSWTLIRSAGQWRLGVVNTGTRRAQIANVSIVMPSRTVLLDAGLMGYALAGQQREWHVAAATPGDAAALDTALAAAPAAAPAVALATLREPATVTPASTSVTVRAMVNGAFAEAPIVVRDQRH